MLPYDDHRRLSILFIIPTDNKLDGIFVRLQSVTIKKIVHELANNPEVKENGIAIPKIKIASTVDLKSLFKRMGIENPLHEKDKVYEMFHKAEFELKQAENNSETAESGDIISEAFAFLIIERHTNTVLLAGQVHDPLKN